MTTHYAVAESVPARNRDYLTPGKRYPIVYHSGRGKGFWINADDGEASFCLPKGCAHLDGGNWTIEPTPSQEGAA